MVGLWLRWGYLTPCTQLFLSKHWRDAVKPHISPDLGPVFTRSKFMKIQCYSVGASMQSWPRGVKIVATRLRIWICRDIGTWCPFLVGQEGGLEDYGNRIKSPLLYLHVWTSSLSLK